MALLTMHHRSMFDDSSPPSHAPNTDAVAFYIGGDTPHVWTDSEIQRTTNRYRLPIWVRSNPNGSGQGHLEGSAVVQWALAHHMPKGNTVALDYETAIDDPYLWAFDAVLMANGYETMLYGSESTVFQNSKPSGGYWGALWDGVANLPNGWAAKQYASDVMLGTSYDLSVISDSVPLWDTQAPPKQIGDDDMPYGTLNEGSFALTVQALPRGKYTNVGLVCDNGLQGKPAAGVRVAIEHQDGSWQVGTFTVDGKKGQTVVIFSDPVNVVGISFRREDLGDVRVAYQVS